ncbi:fibrillin-2-like isoform X2 [Pomacea canaliculata]|uniref:fibrillin-2-like isoform X2 n=1 Tax=Pomacea canaliculata TaxID=400727 RepID=UPI000D73C75B|nr:fibrillin-2-like isoform X2 [Pomacea canaliculata]
MRDNGRCVMLVTLCLLAIAAGKHDKPGYDNNPVNCTDGFRPDDRGGCVDNDECRNSLKCGLGANCINSPGSYECVCNNGFERKNNRCVDIDECYRRTDLCSYYENCFNTIGGYSCLCKIGYIRTKYEGCLIIGHFLHNLLSSYGARPYVSKKPYSAASYNPSSYKPSSYNPPSYNPSSYKPPSYNASSYKPPTPPRTATPTTPPRTATPTTPPTPPTYHTKTNTHRS